MADSDQHTTGGHHEYSEGGEEIKDRGLFDFLGKKEEESKPQEEVIVTEFEHKVQVSSPPPYHAELKTEEAEKPSFIEKLHRSGSSSSSSSDEEEEVEEGGEKKKKKKKGLKEKIKEKISGEKEEEKKEEEHAVETNIPIEKCDDVSSEVAAAHPEEKKGFLEKIKEKLPGGHKKPEECSPTAPVVAEPVHVHEEESKEKKGIFEKIKEKLPGYHKSEEEKKESASEKKESDY